ncbi:hypothetical protein ABT173_47585 [Streptomyces sp. NPDC001795]|uniref:hypothetical protein n=1 Tax=unclassified Streptomyces TaxID=2593676 RepID=UPI0033245AF3
MSLHPVPVPEAPETTARVALAEFPKSCLAMRVRDELGVLFQNADFAATFPARGGPGLSPEMLALVAVMQFAERLTDRQAGCGLSVDRRNAGSTRPRRSRSPFRHP